MSILYSHSTKFTIKGRISYQNKPDMYWEAPENVPPLENTNISDDSNADNSFTENQQRQVDEPRRVNGNQSNQQKTPTTTQYSETPVNQSPLGKKHFSFIIIVLIVAIFVSIYPIVTPNKTDIDNLKQIFPNQPNETFENFEAVIDDILSTKEIHPAVFLFLYDRNEPKVNHLIHHLAKFTTFKLETNLDYIDVPKNEFYRHEAVSDYGYLLDKYKSDLLNKKVMVVKNLQNIPAHVAQVFHSFCDEISPLVKKVVYIFTLKVNSMVGKEEKIAESNLKRLWNELDNDILMPLITRVTSTVLKVSN